MMTNYIYDWNNQENRSFALAKPDWPIEIHDESLRDGLQSPSVFTPNTEQKCELIRILSKIGIDSTGIGFPAASQLIEVEMTEIAKVVAKEKLQLNLTCLARPIESDILPIIKISQSSGLWLEPFIFIGSSPIRQAIEKWDFTNMISLLKQGISFAVKEGLAATCYTEDTTRAHPKDLEQIYLSAIDCGAKMIGIADTVGHATPLGIFNLINFIRNMLNKRGLYEVKIDFHGHMDRGLGLINAMIALSAGANRVHGCVLGIGERSGNVPIDQLLVNLKLMGWIDKDLSLLSHYCETASGYFKSPIPENYPIFGNNAFQTSTGIHASAIIKANNKNANLSDLIYSGVPASWFAKHQTICVGPMSGKSNIIYWLKKNNYHVTEQLINKLLSFAKQAKKVLTDDEIKKILE